MKDSGIDYLIWMCSYKHFEAEVELNFPKVIIYDDFINYDNDYMQSLEL